MTSKEALNVLVNNLDQARLQEASSSNFYWTKYEEVNEAIKVLENSLKEVESIRQALTPPTSEEVCEALSEEIHKKVLYNKDLEEFYYIKDISWRTNEEIMVCAMDFDKEKIVYYNSFGSKSTFLKPKTNILVGRFYEELERKENGKN